MVQQTHASSFISRRHMLSGTVGLLGLGAAGLLAGCARPGKPEPVPSEDSIKAAVTVRAVDNKYIPAEVEIAPGQAVRWVFEGVMEHDVVAQDGSFVSELMTTGSYTHQFTDEGDFAYDCSVHPEMTGVIRVVSA